MDLGSTGKRKVTYIFRGLYPVACPLRRARAVGPYSSRAMTLSTQGLPGERQPAASGSESIPESHSNGLAQ